MHDILVDIVVDTKSADTKFPNRRFAEKWGHEIKESARRGMGITRSGSAATPQLRRYSLTPFSPAAAHQARTVSSLNATGRDDRVAEAPGKNLMFRNHLIMIEDGLRQHRHGGTLSRIECRVERSVAHGEQLAWI
jgi:hypothetical protein